MTARTTVRGSGPAYGQALDVLRGTLPDLAAPIEKHVSALRQEAGDRRMDIARLRHDVDALRDALAHSQAALRIALAARKADR